MNLLFVYERMIIPSFGGAERVTFLLAKAFKNQGDNVFFLSVGPKEFNTGCWEKLFPQFVFSSSEVDFKRNYQSLLDKERIDAVIFQGFHPSVVTAMEFTPSEIVKLATYHNRPFGLTPYERFGKRITPWADLDSKGKVLKSLALVLPGLFRKLNNRVIASRFLKVSSLIDRLVLLSRFYIPRVQLLVPGIDAKKLSAINNPNTFKAVREDESEKKNIILMVGRLSNPQKNVTGFIEVWSRFSKKHPAWKALVVGDGEDREYILNYARKKKIGNLYFEGNRPSVDEYYKKAKILCMTSTYEGWGMVLTEAMAYGCVPVAYNSFEAVNDIIKSEYNGLLVPPFSISKMVEALDFLADNPETLGFFAENAKESIAGFEVEKIIGEWKKLLTTVREERFEKHNKSKTGNVN